MCGVCGVRVCQCVCVCGVRACEWCVCVWLVCVWCVLCVCGVCVRARVVCVCACVRAPLVASFASSEK